MTANDVEMDRTAVEIQARLEVDADHEQDQDVPERLER